MDVTIGEVQARVEPIGAPKAGGGANEDGKQLGPTELAHRARLEQRRSRRIRERLSAS